MGTSTGGSNGRGKNDDDKSNKSTREGDKQYTGATATDGAPVESSTVGYGSTEKLVEDGDSKKYKKNRKRQNGR